MTSKGNSKTTQRKGKPKKQSTATNKKKVVDTHVKTSSKVEQKSSKQVANDISLVKGKSKLLKKGVKRKVEDIEAYQVLQPKLSLKVGCTHLKEYKEKNPDTYLNNFRSIAELSMRWYKFGIPKSNKTSIQLFKHQKCSACNLKGNRLHACLDCVFIGCWRDRYHARLHYKNSNHIFATDVRRLEIFCFKCNDYIYDIDYDNVRKHEEVRAEERVSDIKEPARKRARYIPWKPDEEEAKKIERNSSPFPCSGLRGLLNMGATCFMNAVLQTFMHNPIIKNYFMTDKHNMKICGTSGCMCCEIDNLFQEFHSGEKKPYPPCSFLQSMWLSSKHLAGYSEQDAHEFYLAAIDKMHGDSHETKHQGLNANIQNCGCIMHKTFGGCFQYRRKCSQCGMFSDREEHMVDWQLHLRGLVTNQKKKNGSKASQESNVNEMDVDKNSLEDCLDRYCEKEQLPEYKCEDCVTRLTNDPFDEIVNSCSRTTTCKKLPPVLTFVVERFHRTSTNTIKNEAEFEFPEEIDMAKWTSRGHDILEKGGTLNDLPSYKYNLLSVVNHEGRLDTGHYTVYCKSRDRWFLFDDHAVKCASVEEVLQSRRKAYLCFYVADTLEYDQPRPINAKNSNKR
ncbi:2980_t:CDS:1 [Funneliformis geosporum]|uniref:Ubiquitin carboxyl-terminal hydrolase n=1 Tax=Funneliformis geosporum TaxID=1117311 RepID=A0A9W4WKX9_9GLOM|nr:18881_t:CDS:1 [Funneliformis geosporum]CAI2166249.1 2980_t:CDS:1 [Funneliformis geosporum]